MKCPHCEYEHGWSSELLDNVKGEEDGFYELPVELKRETNYWANETVKLYACPSCKKTFID